MVHSRRLVSGILVFEVMLFALASLAHGGFLVHGFEHRVAAIVEAMLAVLLVVGFIICLARPQSCRAAALLVQGLALLGVCVELVLIAESAAVRSTPDLFLHGAMLLTLLGGFLVALRSGEHGATG